ncbi:MAG: protein-tyrosine-phosphatase [Bacteroidetes bacterium]|nr:protein-tyrosine-phosphatase [Bacteroidota bacterium]
MFPEIKKYCDALTTEFDKIPEQRKMILDKITRYIVAKSEENKAIQLVYICTHNSRRSQFGQTWAQVAAAYYAVKNIHTFSGGTEATAFHANAIHALEKTGLKISASGDELNPIYRIAFDDNEKPLIGFSKVYDHPGNPASNFIAIMTCSEAEENCPFVGGAELKIATTYDDPKAFDGSDLQEIKYDERCRQIALESFYVFSNVHSSNPNK